MKTKMELDIHAYSVDYVSANKYEFVLFSLCPVCGRQAFIVQDKRRKPGIRKIRDRLLICTIDVNNGHIFDTVLTLKFGEKSFIFEIIKAEYVLNESE